MCPRYADELGGNWGGRRTAWRVCSSSYSHLRSATSTEREKRIEANGGQNRDNAIRTLMLEEARNPLLISANVKSAEESGLYPAPVQAVKEAANLTPEAFALANSMAAWFYRVEIVHNLSELSEKQRLDFDLKSLTSTKEPNWVRLGSKLGVRDAVQMTQL